jgi:flagellar biosynthesis protein FlhG
MDIDVGKAISSVCKRYFGVDVNYAAYLDYDNTVWKSVRSRKPLLHEFPHSTLADRLQKMTLVLTGKEKSIYP